jgi:NADP-dependent 3-hydroxy acid dehydrogenase YdfG
MQLKPINQQVVAVVGASSGIGRETAIQFAARGIALREILASTHGRTVTPPGWKPIQRQSGV